MKNPRETKPEGFTLIEVVTVLATLGILLMISLPTISKWIPNIELQSAARNLVSQMEQAKVEAIKRNADVVFTFNPAGTCPGGSYTFTDSGGDLIVSNSFDDNICLTLPTPPPAAPSGYTPRNLPIGGTAGAVVLSHARTATRFQINQNIAGGISLDRL